MAQVVADVRKSTATDARRRILDAALACFARAGFHGTSMQEVCAEARMSPGALYRYFPSKDSIIEAIAAEEREHNGRFLRSLDVETDVLETFLDTGFAWLRETGQGKFGPLCCEVMAEARRNPRIRAVFERNHAEARNGLRRALEKARANGEIDAAIDLDVVVTTIMAIGDGLLASAPLQPAIPPERFEPALRELILRMLRPRDVQGQPLGQGQDKRIGEGS